MSKVSMKEGNRRLLVLAELLENLPRKRFNYSHWVGEDWKGKKDLSCGTTACALGWATTIPEFKRRGLRLLSIPCSCTCGTCPPKVKIAMRGTTDSIESAMRLFGVEEEQAVFLFTPGEELGGRESPGGSATPKQVARHIRRFVKERS